MALTKKQRGVLIAIALAGSVCIAVVLAFNEGPTPDLLLGVLAIGALVSVFLATVGRVPSNFEAGGLILNFEGNDLQDLKDTINSALADDDVARSSIIELIDKAARGGDGSSGAAAGAGARADEASSSPDQKDSSRDKVRASLKGALGAKGFAEAWAVTGSGIGKPPKFDFCADVSGVGKVAIEVEDYSNKTTVEIVRKKSARALQKGTDVDKVVIIANVKDPSPFNVISGENSGAKVVSLDEFVRDPKKWLEDQG